MLPVEGALLVGVAHRQPNKRGSGSPLHYFRAPLPRRKLSRMVRSLWCSGGAAEEWRFECRVHFRPLGLQVFRDAYILVLTILTGRWVLPVGEQ